MGLVNSMYIRKYFVHLHTKLFCARTYEVFCARMYMYFVHINNKAHDFHHMFRFHFKDDCFFLVIYLCVSSRLASSYMWACVFMYKHEYVCMHVFQET